MKSWYRKLHLLLSATFMVCQPTHQSREELNNRPIIGILSQAIPSSLDAMLPPGHNFTTYLAASYVKWVEGAGARAVPIIVSDNEDNLDYYDQMFTGINGLLIPGGAVSIYSSPYATAATYLVDLARLSNEAGEVFPVWGTCLGFEMLGAISTGGEPYLARCDSNDQGLALELLDGYSESKLLGEAPGEMISDMTSSPVTANFHHWCLTRENFTKFEIDTFWDILSVNKDVNGLEFVSTMEAKNYPIFGTQFHPEKNAYEWAPKYPGIPHTSEAIRVGRYFAEFFINLARQSSHKFESRAAEERHLSYNYQPFYSGSEDRNWGFQQAYVFSDNSNSISF